MLYWFWTIQYAYAIQATACVCILQAITCNVKHKKQVFACILPFAQFTRGNTMEIEQIRLKECRLAKKLTQKEVADKLGISQQAYQQLETGRTTDMRISTLKRLCIVLETSADWLLGIGEESSK